MPAGRPPKPAHLIAISGTERKDRPRAPEPQELDMEALDAVPPAPLWLPNAHSTNEWYRLAAILIKNKLLNDGNLSALAQLCALHGKIVQLYAAGECPGASMLGTLRTMLNDFGLTPVSQGKIKSAQPATPEVPASNPFHSVGRKPA